MKERLVGLDIFRIICAVVIFMFHSQMFIECNYGILYDFTRMGAIFMTAFFMLSGFALYYSYCNTRLLEHDALIRFYISRFISIMPLYWFITIIYMAISIKNGSENLVRILTLLPIELLGIQNAFTTLFNVAHNSMSWFVSCIIGCYLLFPVILTFVNQLNRKALLMLSSLMIMFHLYSPIAAAYLETDIIYSNTFFRIVEFIIGVILCALWQDLRKNKVLIILENPAIPYISYIILIALVTYLSRFEYFGYDHMMYNLVALPIFAFTIICHAQSDIKNNGVICYLSAISYAFYLTQFFAFSIISFIVYVVLKTNNNIVKIIVSFATCLVLAIILHELVEKPCKKLMNKYRRHAI